MKIRRLLILPLLVLCIGVGSVKAADEGIKTVSLSKSGIQLNISGTHSGYFYMSKLGNNITLCMNPGKRLSSGAKYQYSYSIPATDGKSMTDSEEMMAKAYLFAQANAGNETALAAAQVIIWLGGGDNDIDYEHLDQNALYNGIRTALNSYPSSVKSGYNKSVEALAEDYLRGIVNTSASGAKIYVWTHVGGGAWQDLLTAEPPDCDEETQCCESGTNYKKPLPCPPETTTKKDTCKIKIADELPTCADDVYNYGYVYEYATGKCEAGFVKSKNNVNSKLGKKEIDYGSYCRMYCLKKFEEKLPGNIPYTVNAGRYLVWPNNKINENEYQISANLDKYPFKTTLEKSCKISPDSKALNTDYTTAYKNYTSHVNSYRSIYNRYIADKLSCKHFEDELQKAEKALEACENACSGVPGCSCSAERAAVRQAREDLKNCQQIPVLYKKVENVVKDFNNCITANASLNLNYSLGGVKVSYNDPTYGKTYNLTQSTGKDKCQDCNSTLQSINITPYNALTNYTSVINQRVSQISARDIVSTSMKKYDLSSNFYSYIDKDKNKAVNSSSGLTNYSTVGFTNMPISYDAKTNKKYNLEIQIGSATGDTSDFNKYIKNNDYVCHYKVTKTTGGCTCPEGTAHAGESLLCAQINGSGNGMTCADMIYEYCDDDSYDISHGSDSKKCPDDTPSSNDKCIQACMNQGYSYDSCKSFCSGGCIEGSCYSGGGGTEKYVCPKGGTNEGMDLTACVIPMILRGSSEKDAYEYCKDVTCPYKNGIKIIYRVIDLDNPFPSKDADATVVQKNLSKGMFNDYLKGRYPGSNWNSEAVVEDKILYNRGVDGDDVYSKRPLYTFVLNSQRIKAIRSYNKSQKNSYSDFNLKCYINNSAACQSSFVHGSLSGLTGGTCSSVSKTNFYTCNLK